LTRIEAGACKATGLALVVVPESTLFISGDAFPHSCAVTLAGSDSDAEFGAWNRVRQLGSSNAFERRISGMGKLGKNESGENDEGKASFEGMGKLD
jgi:hypothetical protein